MARETTRMVRPRRKKLDRVTQVVLLTFFVVAGITIVLAVFWIRSLFQSAPAQTKAPAAANAGQTNNAGSNVPAPKGPLQPSSGPASVPWDGKSRVTVLIMGLDYRDWEAGSDIPRTDSMILLSVDPMSRKAGILSIPRDMWVDIPGIGKSKINTAYRWGEINKLPGGGPGLAMKTVENTLGMPVDYYAVIDFNAFVKFIDELGGLDMKIREEIVIDPIGPGNTRKLEPGTQTLTGAEVLAYARNRYTEGNDFDRSRRQQEVIMAIRKQVLQFNMLPTLITKAPALYQEIASGISTNLTLDQVIRLAMVGSQISEDNIKKGVISAPEQVEIATNPSDGQSILIPNASKIRILRDEVFVGGEPISSEVVDQPVTTPQATQVNLAQLMKDEKATVIVMNGTATTGLAKKTGDYLKSLGVNVIDEGNADPTNTTTIYLYTNKPSTARFLLEKFKLSDTQMVVKSDANPPADIKIVLGADRQQGQ